MKKNILLSTILITALLITTNITNAQWIQIGQDVDGEDNYSYSGCSVSLSDDGSIMAMGAMFNSGNGTDAGHVRVYENISGTWYQIGNDIDGEAATNYSGISVDLNSTGTIVAIGACMNNGVAGTNSGHVRVYENISGTWHQIGQDIDGEAAGDQSGFSVNLNANGSIVAIGARYNDGTASSAGHVRVYENISGNWTQIGADIDGDSASDYFGWSVSLDTSGTIILGTK